VLTGARLAQGLGAAMMTPAALSILTTSFAGGSDWIKAIGAWSGTIPLASVFGVLLGGLVSQGPGWRWVFFVNVPVCAVVIAAALRIIPGERTRAPVANFDALGAILSTAGMLVLVYALVNAPASVGAQPGQSANWPPRWCCWPPSWPANTGTATRWSRCRSSTSKGSPRPTPLR
jgi:MFS family permease